VGAEMTLVSANIGNIRGKLAPGLAAQ